MGGCASHPKELGEKQPLEEKPREEQKISDEKMVAVSNEEAGSVKSDDPKAPSKNPEDPTGELKGDEENAAAAEAKGVQKDEAEELSFHTGDGVDTDMEPTSKSSEENKATE